MENGLLTVSVTGDEIRKLCDGKIQRIAAACEKTTVALRKELEFQAQAEAHRQRGYLAPASFSEASIVRIEESAVLATRELTFLRDHVDATKNYQVYWRDLRDLFFAEGFDGMARVPMLGCA